MSSPIDSTGSITVGGEIYKLYQSLNIKLIIYILVVIAVEIVAIIIAMRMEPPMLLMLAIFVPLSLYVFYIYGRQWFGANGAYANKLIPWPPAINSCPDFLTAYNLPATSSRPAITGCVDLIGVSIKGVTAFPKIDANGEPSWPNPPTAPITTSTTDANGATMLLSTGFFATKVAGEKVPQVCKRLQVAGLTWDGIWDGMNCFSNGSNIPVDAGGSECPS
jgi:hypothetical protein